MITINMVEAEKIICHPLKSYQDMQDAAHAIIASGANNVLLKGGDVKDTLFSQDYWTNGSESFWIASPRLHKKPCCRTGDTFSLAITNCLELGYSIKDAIVIAKMVINRGIRLALDLEQNPAKLFDGDWPEDQEDLPYISAKPLSKLPEPFKSCQIGLYPVVDSSNWLEKLLPLGVKCIQLRIKDADRTIIEEDIKRSVYLAKKYGATLFVNDYWDLAIRHGADGIHLGQEDLHHADIDKIHQSGLCLGVSTHSYYEVSLAHTLNPSYIACGHIYPTTSKVMPSQPQGIEQLHRWRRTLRYPLVAIGGINSKRVPEVLKSGVEGISLISAITKACDPILATQELLRQTSVRGFNLDKQSPAVVSRSI